MRKLVMFPLAAMLNLLCAFSWAQSSPMQVGIFESHGDVGTVLHAGSVDYDGARHTYTISGSGENMWLAADAFQFAWKKISGDVTLTADISFLTKTGNEHKKAVLILRQSLDADSVYADVALHASGLTSLQFRDETGGVTHEVQSSLSAPKRLRIAKRGDYVYMSLSNDGEPRVAGGWLRIPLQGTFYVGLGVCSHDKDVVEQAVFSNVELTQPVAASGKPVLYSTLETIEVDSTDRRVAYLASGRFEAPNWTRDGKAFLFNRDGHIERLAVGSDQPVPIDTGFANRCNNDHGISPDSTQLAISDNSQGDHESMVYLVPMAGGTPRRITEKSPSYWHGWSPDGKTLAFVGQRDGEFDVYTIPVTGGKETRLTTAKGLDDGPEYSPDGKYIYFNSERTGHMQIWRMKPDGSEQEQVFSDDLNNWFPHISPDGKWMVFLTYGADVTGHPENKDVMLRLMSLDPTATDKKITVLAKLFGGQGTINVPSWSPDSEHLALVSYMLLPSIDFAGAELTDDDYAIYAAVIQKLFSGKFARIVLSDQTMGGYGMPAARMANLGRQRGLEEVPESLCEGLRDRNRLSGKLDAGKFRVEMEVKIIPWASVGAGFNFQYSGSPGNAVLSLPAVNAEKNQALVYIATTCGGLCGGGEIVVLSKLDGQWIVQKAVTVWMS